MVGLLILDLLLVGHGIAFADGTDTRIGRGGWIQVGTDSRTLLIKVAAPAAVAGSKKLQGRGGRGMMEG